MSSRLFLSYARSDDGPFVARLSAALKGAGFDIWFDRVSNDIANISAGLRAADVIRSSTDGTGRGTLSLHVHVADPQLRKELNDRRLPEDSQARFRADAFSVFENSARLLLLDHPLDHVIQINADDPRHVQLILAGFGYMGEAILIRAALAGHYANMKRLRAVVMDPFAQRAERVFRARYPQFDNVANVQFLDRDPEEPDTQNQIAALCDNLTENISTVVVPLEQSTRALGLAFSLQSRLRSGVPIRVRLEKDAGIGNLIQRHSHGCVTPPCPITPFGTIAAACRAEDRANGNLDVMARALHENYVLKLGESEKSYPANPSAAPWELLSDQLRESNRQAADHIPVKLRAVACHAAWPGSGDPGELVLKFSDEEVEMLAKMEHRRWMAERFLAGWVLGPKDNEKRVSPYLVEWEELPTHPTNIPECVRNAVRIIPGVLSRVGIEIRR